MGLSKVSKIQIIGHRRQQEDVLNLFQETGLVELSRPVMQEEDAGNADIGAEGLENKIQVIDQMIGYLDGFEKKGLLEGMVKEKVLLEARAFSDMVKLDQDKFQNDVKAIQKETSELDVRRKRLEDSLSAVTPWLNLPGLLSDIKSTEHTEIIPAAIPAKNLPLLQEYMNEKFSDRFSLEVINRDRQRVYVLIVMLKQDMQEFSPADYELNRADLPCVGKTVPDYRKELEQDMAGIRERKCALEKKAAGLSAERISLMAYHDYLLNIKNKNDAKKQSFYFPHAFVLEGWVRNVDLKAVRDTLNRRFSEIEILAVEPEEGEVVPVALENIRVVTPFELLTRLYGVPGRAEVDPTPSLTPFFMVFFGLCLTDAGYGIVLMITMYAFMYIKKRRLKMNLHPLIAKVLFPFSFLYKMVSASNLLMRMLFLGGLFTIAAGVITGGWFGDAASRFPFMAGLKKFMLFDPMENPIIFLAVALALGFIQVCYGLCMRIYEYVKNKLFIDALCSPFSQLMIMMGAPLMGATLMHLLPRSLFPLSIAMLIFGLGNLFFYSFMNTKGSFLIRFVMGGYSVYNVLTGCLLADILSYSRLLALGMATAGIAVTINIMTDFAVGMTAGIPFVGSIIGAVIAFVILYIGHLFNLVINAFGGFVHSLRLQYVEFFTKFYEGGGRELRPFSKEYKYVAMK